jgi:hypothetical protein
MLLGWLEYAAGASALLKCQLKHEHELDGIRE